MTKKRHTEPFKSTLMHCLGLGLLFFAVNTQGQSTPRASGMYIARSSSWVKTTTTSNTGNTNTTSTYSSGGRSWNNLPGSGRTRIYNNGTTTYSYNWNSTDKNYQATPAYKAPYLDGWTITTNVRYGCSHAMDYDIPPTWLGYLDILVELICQPVNGRGQDSGNSRRKYYNRLKRTGESGRIFISPYSGSYTKSSNSEALYFRED